MVNPAPKGGRITFIFAIWEHDRADQPHQRIRAPAANGVSQVTQAVDVIRNGELNELQRVLKNYA
jgi:hypothetical protein